MGEKSEPSFKLKPSTEVGVGPKKRNLKQWLAGTAAGAALLAAAGIQIDRTIDANTADLGKPLSDHSLTVDLQSITNANQEKIPPTFRDDPLLSGKELSQEELEERGIDVSSGSLKIREVEGGTYAGNPQNEGSNVDGEEGTQGYGFVKKDNEPNVGIWGEVIVDGKPTGVYLSKNYYTEAKPEQPPAESSQ